MHRFDIVAGVIELAVLGLLREQELHGYELRKQLGELLGSRLAVSFGSLYPALNRLEADGSVKAVEAATEPASLPTPSSGSLAGEASAFLSARRRASGARRSSRGKKVYGITDRGIARLVELLEDPALDERSFALKVAFCAELPADRRLELFERRRADLTRQLADVRSSRERRRAAATGESKNRYLRSLREHDTESTQHHVAWLDALIAEERAALAGAPTRTDAGGKDPS